MCVFRLILQVVNTSTWRLRRWWTAVARDPRKTDSWYNVIFACAGSTAHALEWKRKTRLEHFPKFRRCTTFHLNWRGSRRFFRQIADAVTKLNVFSLWPLDVALSLLSIFFVSVLNADHFDTPCVRKGAVHSFTEIEHIHKIDHRWRYCLSYLCLFVFRSIDKDGWKIF